MRKLSFILANAAVFASSALALDQIANIQVGQGLLSLQR